MPTRAKLRLQRIAGRDREAVAVLDVVQQVLRAQLVVQRNQVLPGQNRSLAALVEIEAAQVDDEAELQRAVEEVRLGEAQADIAHAGAELRIERQRLAQTEEVVGGVIEPHEAAGDAGDAAVQADRVLAALLHLEGDVHRVGLRVALDVGRFFLLQHFEVAELVEAQDAEIPELGVEHVAFVEQDLAADDLVARGGVAGEIDAADEELLAFVGGQGEIDLVACSGRCRSWARERNR